MQINLSPQRAQRTQSTAATFALWNGIAPQRIRTRMTRIARIFTDPCASASSAQSVFHYIPSAFICVHLRLTFVSLSDRIQEIQLKLFPIINDYQTHSCLNLLENKPQINADERRFVHLNFQHFFEVYAVNDWTKSPQMAGSSAMPVTLYEKASASRFRTRMTRIARIFTDPCASASSAQSVFYHRGVQ